MGLSLYNTLSRRKEEFHPVNPERVGMYVCGPTVYDLAHIGNARPVLVFDVIFRNLCRIYGEENVIYVRNITDIDDKINNAAIKSGVSIDSITSKTIDAFHSDIAELNALPPTIEPLATDHIPEMIKMIVDLVDGGFAYKANNHVLFDVNSNSNYGRLSGRTLDEMISGARVEVAPYKRNPADFILWKPSNPDLPGWDSPWGRGRPGWHIECSAMSRKHIGLTLDIHGGGLDLIFPHHENEIAQSECSCVGHKFVNYWVHNGYLTVDGDKMSKSLGNFVTIRDALKKFPGEVIRLFMLSSHYRSPIDWNESNLYQARNKIDRLYKALRAAQDIDVKEEHKFPSSGVISALEDDINTPAALNEIYGISSELNKVKDDLTRSQLKGSLLASCYLLGILNRDVESWFHELDADDGLSVHEIDKLIDDRAFARDKKNFAEADRIRLLLEKKGIILEDSAEGTSWRRDI